MNILRYPDNLLKIEIGQQFHQLDLFEEDGSFKKEYSLTINNSIEKVLNLNGNDGNNYTIEFPSEIESKLSVELKNKVCRELSGNEIRMLTSILALAQAANNSKELFYIEKTNQAYFEFSFSQLYEACGLLKEKSGKYGKRSKDYVISSLLSLHRKDFLVPYKYIDSTKKVRGFAISPLIMIHGIEEWENLSDRKKSNRLKITVSGVFFNIYEKRHSYFNLPINLNRKLRTINPGRPNAGIELFIKCLYQALHCAKTDKVEYSHNRIMDIMKLDRHKKNNHSQRIKPTIKKGFATALKLDIIKEYKEAKTEFGGLKYVITLNKKLKG